MKSVVIGWMLCAACFAADAKKIDAKKTTARPAAKAAAVKKPAPAVTIPAGATKVDETTYTFKDNAGKVWVYQKTPFGVSKTEQSAVTAANMASASGPQKPTDSTPFGKLNSSAPASSVKAVEDGDSIRFEKATPFGVQKWTRKKAELNEDERAIWERQKGK